MDVLLAISAVLTLPCKHGVFSVWCQSKPSLQGTHVTCARHTLTVHAVSVSFVRFDGAMGVLLAISAVKAVLLEALHRAGERA